MSTEVNMVTIGVADTTRSTRFYEGLRFLQGRDELCFALASTTLALHEWDGLAGRAGVSPGTRGFRGCALSATFGTAAEVDVVLAGAAASGARIVKPARSAIWGGYSGYFADLDGHLWKIASTSKPVRGSRHGVEEAGQPTATSAAVTLGVAAVKRTRQFYEEELGFRVEKAFGGKFVSFVPAAGSWTLGLYTRAGLAKDAGVAAEGEGFGGMTPATLDRAGRGDGGRYLTDPDGYVWQLLAREARTR
jgi:catechol 2,3-dioxygenase-like lactoylglutathione lyase family enzyme